MVVTDSEVISHSEVESPLQPDQQPNKNHPFSSLGRQSSIYTLTLDEFQHALCESGKNFGSMNMDEFLTSIWNAEENQATATSSIDHLNNNNRGNQVFNDLCGDRGICKQPSLPRQGSLSLPAPLCRKTVDEVWSEIHREQQQQQGEDQSQSHINDNNNVQNPDSTAQQPTFGEMTLEDFLIKAGVVREQCSVIPPLSVQPLQQQPYGLYQSNNSNNNNPDVGTNFVSRPVMGMATAAAAANAGAGAGAGYQTMTQNVGPPQAAAPPPGSVYAGRVGNGGGGGGYAPSQGMGVVGQVSPVSTDAMVNSSIDNAANQFGIDMGVLRGRKRIIDGPVEKVVERRQRRMIKNRESAARSRARKQAYTVELEAELNQLKEENKQLRHALAELERKRKQQYLEELRMKVQTKAQKTKEKLRMMRRNLSCPL